MRMLHDVIDVLQTTFSLMAGLDPDAAKPAGRRPADNDNDTDPERARAA
ncbi:MAG: hypothetical protein AAFX39_09170 [Pseudomonadota bacterium]